MDKDEKAIECLKALQIVKKYLDEEERSRSDIEWIDSKGYSIHTDIGYFFDGLEGLENCLIKRLRGEVPNEEAVKWE